MTMPARNNGCCDRKKKPHCTDSFHSGPELQKGLENKNFGVESLESRVHIINCVCERKLSSLQIQTSNSDGY